MKRETDKVIGIFLAALVSALFILMAIPTSWVEVYQGIAIAIHRIIHDFLWGIFH